MQATEQHNITLPLHNWEAVHQLEREKNYLSNVAAGIGAASIASGALLGSPGFLLLALAYDPLDQVKKLARLLKVMFALLENFEHLGVQVFPTLKVPEKKNPIDLFVRFPRKAHIIISIRSKGESEIVYNEAKEALYVKRGKKGLKDWQPCPLVELGDYTNWLTKNRQLFGMSSKEVRNVPLSKVLVVWNPTKISTHREHLYSTIESLKLLVLKRKGTAFVIPDEDIINFVRAYLAHYEAQKEA